MLILTLLGCFCVRAAGAPLRIMPVGDSITKGSGSYPNFNGYRKPLYLKLINEGYDVDFVGTQTDGDFADPNHEGHGSWTDFDIAWGQVGYPIDGIYAWLEQNPADIILLHIGTNNIDTSPDDVEDILDEVDSYESDYSKEVLVFVARIIKLYGYEETVRIFNDNVQAMVQDRISNPNNPAYPDNIIPPNDIDMENTLIYPDDYTDYAHPNNSGYAKMADVWYNAMDSVIIPPSINSEPITNTVISNPYSYDVNATGYPEPAYELTTCPDGMTIDYNTGLIEWLPTSVGDFNVTVEASNGRMPDAIQSFVITVTSAISHIGDIGTAADKTTGTNLVIQTTADVNAGDDIILAFATYGDPYYEVSVTDDVNNTYKEVAQAICYTHGRTYIFAAYDVNTLPSDSNITIIHTEVEARAAVASVFRGLLDVNALDQSLGNPAPADQNERSGTVAFVGPTDTTSQVNELLIGAIGTEGPVDDDPGTWQYWFTAGPRDGTSGGSSDPNWTVSMGWRIASETGEYLAEVNDITNRYWAAAIATFRGPTFIISGNILEPNSTPIEGVTVLVDTNDVNIVSDPNGYYEVIVAPGWSGTVTPIKNGYLFDPAERSYSNVVTNLLDQDYKNISKYDLDDNESIGWGDIGVICNNWLLTGPNVPGDIYKDEDNIVNLLDFTEFAEVW